MASKYIILTLAIGTLALLIHSSVLVTGQDLLFTETLAYPQNYASFIQKIRGNKNLVYTHAGGVPMLPPKEVSGNKHFHIILKQGDCSITAQIQQVNLYLVAFKGSNGSWYAFKDDVNKAPPNSIPLPFDGSYPGSVASTIVGRKSLENAICVLANYHENEGQQIRSLLVKLMVMFPEAIRFKRVAEFVNPYMLSPTTEPEIGPDINELIHNWGAISPRMRQYDKTGKFTGFPDLNINTVEQARSTVGILLFEKKLSEGAQYLFKRIILLPYSRVSHF